jgi:hypothetical protein
MKRQESAEEMQLIIPSAGKKPKQGIVGIIP